MSIKIGSTPREEPIKSCEEHIRIFYERENSPVWCDKIHFRWMEHE